VRLAYLCNVYPAVSHSFVRREIEGVEAAGHEVHRFSIRPPQQGLKDRADLREASATEAILGHGIARLCVAALSLSLSRPGKALGAVATALRLSGPCLGRRARHLVYWLEAGWLVQRMEQLGVSHVHAHFGTNPAAVAAIARAWGGPTFSFTAHGPDEFDAPVTLSLASKIKAASFVAAISSYGKSQLMRWSDPAEWDKIKIVRCGVDAEYLNSKPRPIPANSTEFVCIARLSAQKGLPLLLDACAQLRANGERFSLMIIGDGELRETLRAQIDRQKLNECVALAGAASSTEIRGALARARAFVLPSFAEGLPVVLMEALAMARPVITTAIAGIPELVDGECGWLIPAGSTDSLVAAMMEALRATPQDLKAKGAVGRERVRTMHDARRNAGGIIEAIAELHAVKDSLVLDDVEAAANPVDAVAHDSDDFGELAQEDKPRRKRRVARRQPAA
jgi:glycosyltransferase involved in cell wall biosynthesis